MKKRICAVIMSIVIVLNLVGVQKAKAVVAEAGFIGSLVGIVMSSMGYTWAANNMNEQGFGDALADAVQDYLNIEVGGMSIEEWALFETCVQLSGNNSLIIQQALVKKISDFADWFTEKFGLADSSSVPVFSGPQSITLKDGRTVSLGSVVSHNTWFKSQIVGGGSIPVVVTGVDDDFHYLYLNDTYYFAYKNYGSPGSWYFPLSYSGGMVNFNASHSSYTVNPYEQVLHFGTDGTYLWMGHVVHLVDGDVWNSVRIPLSELTLNPSSSLDVGKSPTAQNPDIADDGTQAYELTIANLTAKDLEELISAAVAQAIAGTLAVEGTVTEAVEPVAPPLAGDYAVPGLETIFPFCIPFDIYAFCSALNAEPVAPCFEWQMQYAPLGLDYTFEIDLSDFDDVARILRTMELLAFCVGLAFWTRHLIRG